ncbi:hypothetical protein QQF64_018111 [Cirrhinus molitorella]|uniref:UPAR/Ly6 domain-containing protein n=1 Tax=Cirrhinus molitorella TaxID=172907 RepID=A0ABR3LKK5_9TELE
MHLQVSIVVLFIPLTGGYSLECYACEPGQYCQYSTRTCYDKCRSTKTVDYFGPHREEADNRQRERARTPIRIKNKHATCPGTGQKQETMSKGCANPHDCKSWSLGTGCWTREYVAECCSSYRCNEKYVSVYFSHNPNGKRCYTCDEEDCSKTLSCWGQEDYCFTAYEPSSQQSLATKGCASKSACDQEPGEILGLNGNITCCEGNLCNVAQSGTQSGTQSFLFLCCSLLSFILLH